MSEPAGTVGSVLLAATRRLTAAGVEGARRDARLLLAEVLARPASDLLGLSDLTLTAAQGAAFEAMVARRAAREPVSRILGRRGFWSLEFLVGPDTLDPRPDTETVVEAALDALPGRDRAWRILDLGTGTGCILLSLLHERPAASGLGIDIAPGAIEVARANAQRLGLAERAEFRLGDWLAGLDEEFDAIVSNPPYIPRAEVETLAPEVLHYDPLAALSGGADGLAPYRVIATGAVRLLRSGGSLIVEVGAGQADDVADLFRRAGLRVEGIRRDLAGIARCVTATNA